MKPKNCGVGLSFIRVPLCGSPVAEGRNDAGFFFFGGGGHLWDQEGKRSRQTTVVAVDDRTGGGHRHYESGYESLWRPTGAQQLKNFKNISQIHVTFKK